MSIAIESSYETQAAAYSQAGIVRDLLTPPSKISTKELIEKSSLARINEWVLVANCATVLRGAQFQELAKETFIALQSESPEVTDRRLVSPVFRGWLAWTGFGLHNLDRYKEFVESYLDLWNNMRFSLAEPGSYKAVLGAIDGVCFTWDPRIICAVGNRDNVHVSRDNTRLTICDLSDNLLWDGHVTPQSSHVLMSCNDCCVLHAPCLPGTEVMVRNDIPVLRLKLSGTSQRETGIIVGERESKDLYKASPGLCLEAGDILRQAWSDEYQDFSQTLQLVVPCASCDEHHAKGMTVSSHQGAIWIMADDLLSSYESMVHEQSHVKLRYIEEAYPILAPEQTQERFLVAWRSDPRPIVGIYEGIYVTVHCILAIRRALDAALVPNHERQAWRQRSMHLRANVHDALHIMQEHARFTEAGALFLDWAVSELE